MMSSTNEPMEILLVEDNPADIRFTEEVLKETEIKNRLHVTVDGMDALEFLRREGKYAGVPKPDIILLDLNMPKKSGLEMLADIQDDDDLRNIPVVILTTSDGVQDINHSFGLSAKSYITKPIDAERVGIVLGAVKYGDMPPRSGLHSVAM